MSVVIAAYVEKSQGLVWFDATDSVTGKCADITSVPSNPSITIAGTTYTVGGGNPMYGPIWNNTTQNLPLVCYQITGVTIAQNAVATFTWAANGIHSSSGNSPAATNQTIDTSFAGSLNPNSVGGVPAMAVSSAEMTMPVGMGMAYAPSFVNFSNFCPSANARYRLALVAGSGTSSITYDAADITLVDSWTAGGTITSFFWNSAITNGIEVGSPGAGQVGYPTPAGKWVIQFTDANATNSNKLNVWFGVNIAGGTACTGGDTASTHTVADASRVVGPGNLVTITYTLSYTPGAGATDGYNFDIHLYAESAVGLWASGNTISNFWIFTPFDSNDLTTTDPYRISNHIKSVMTTASGKGPATWRMMESLTQSGGINNMQVPADLQNKNGFSWGLRPITSLSLSYVRAYNTNPSDGTYAWSSPHVYHPLLGQVLDVTNGEKYIDLTTTGPTDNGQFFDTWGAGQGANPNGWCVLEFGTTTNHNLRSGDIINIPVVPPSLFLPITGGGTQTLTNTTLNNASTTVTLSAPAAIVSNSYFIFSGDSTGIAYKIVLGAGAQLGAAASVTVNNGGTTLTWLASVTLLTGQTVVVSTDGAHTVYTITTGGTGTTFTFSPSFLGTSSTTATVNQAPTGSVFTLNSAYGGSNTTTSTMNLTAAVGWQNVNAPCMVTSPTTFIMVTGNTVGVISGTTVQRVASSQQYSQTGLGLTVVPAQPGGNAPYALAANFLNLPGWSDTILWIDVNPYSSDACLNAIVDEMAPILPANSIVRVECGLEPWNQGFPVGEMSYPFAKLIGYLPPLTTVNEYYISTSGTSTALGSTMAGYTLMAARCQDVMQARFNTYNNGVQIDRVFNTWIIEAIPYTQRIISFACGTLGSPTTGGLQKNIPISTVVGDRYMDSPTDSTWTAACNAAGGNLSMAQIEEYYRHFLAYASDQQGYYTAQQNQLALYTGPAAINQIAGIPALESYEASVENVVGAGTINQSHDAFYHPFFYDTTTKAMHSWQYGNPNVSGSGMKRVTIFQFCGPWNAGAGTGRQLWMCQLWPGQPIGDGSSNLYTTNQGAPGTGNGLCNDFQNSVVGLGAMLAWMDEANPTPGSSSTGGGILNTATDEMISMIVLAATQRSWYGSSKRTNRRFR